MKIYFYGASPKAAKKKCETFITTLMNNVPGGKKLNLTSICVPCFSDKDDNVVIPKGYKYHVYCEYNITSETKS